MSRVSQARNLGKYFLLIDNMLVVLGFFVVFPLISIRFVDQMGWAAVMVGIALGLRQFIQQGLGIFGGAIADRFGAGQNHQVRRAQLPRYADACRRIRHNGYRPRTVATVVFMPAFGTRRHVV